MFYSAAECYEKKEERRISARYYALAGQTYFDIGSRSGNRKAAKAYGKAITRYLLADDLQGAIFLLEKGKSQGFDTYHFQMAEEALEGRIKELGPVELETLPIESIKKEKIVLPKIVPLSEPIEIPSDVIDVLVEKEEIMPIVEAFSIEDPIDDESFSERTSRALLENISEEYKHTSPIETSSSVEFVTLSGEKKTIEPKLTVVPLKPLIDPFVTHTTPILSTQPDYITTEETELVTAELEIEESDLIDIETPERELTTFSSLSEVINPLEEEITEVEIIDKIPFAFQVVDIESSDLTLEKREVSPDGLLFSWSKDRLAPGEKIQVHYRLRKRIHRSIVMRSGKKINLIDTYHSLHEQTQNQLTVDIPYTNVSGAHIDEILIEDSIPAELLPRAFKPKSPVPVRISGIEETLFRWIIKDVSPGFYLGVGYDFTERPVTRWYERVLEDDRGTKLKVRKIAQPNPNSLTPEMLIFHEISCSLPIEFDLLDEVPSNAEIISVEPNWQKPRIITDKNQHFLFWSFTFKANERQRFILRLKSKMDYTALEPIVKFKNYEILEGREVKKKKEKEVLDLRSFVYI